MSEYVILKLAGDHYRVEWSEDEQVWVVWDIKCDDHGEFT